MEKKIRPKVKAACYSCGRVFFTPDDFRKISYNYTFRACPQCVEGGKPYQDTDLLSEWVGRDQSFLDPTRKKRLEKRMKQLSSHFIKQM